MSAIKGITQIQIDVLECTKCRKLGQRFPGSYRNVLDRGPMVVVDHPFHMASRLSAALPKVAEEFGVQMAWAFAVRCEDPPSSDRRRAEYVDKCRGFTEDYIKILKPQCIFALGIESAVSVGVATWADRDSIVGQMCLRADGTPVLVHDSVAGIRGGEGDERAVRSFRALLRNIEEW